MSIQANFLKRITNKKYYLWIDSRVSRALLFAFLRAAVPVSGGVPLRAGRTRRLAGIRPPRPRPRDPLRGGRAGSPGRAPGPPGGEAVAGLRRRDPPRLGGGGAAPEGAAGVGRGRLVPNHPREGKRQVRRQRRGTSKRL
eukprot:1178601-Prorocentrum_minimum.AAC.3